jgi:tetratricopeptide (TPR) repeat protein
MSLPAWNERTTRGVAPVALGGLALAALAVLTACGSHRTRPESPAGTATAPPAASTPGTPSGAARGAGAPKSGTAPAAGAASSPGGAPGAGAAPIVPVHPDVPPAARSDFDRAVNFMRAGNRLEAELGFKQVALQYPQFAAPLVNLAILERKDSHLDEAEQTLKNAVAREPGSAVAWTELGVTQRLRGEFKDAASSYEQAIAADPRYAAAWRNLGVVADLYLADPNRALKAFEQYRQITGEDKPVSGWIAELRQRLGMAPAKRPAAEGSPPSEVSPGTPPAGNPGAAPRGAPEPAPHGSEPQAEPAPAETVAAAPTRHNARRAGG